MLPLIFFCKYSTLCFLYVIVILNSVNREIIYLNTKNVILYTMSFSTNMVLRGLFKIYLTQSMNRMLFNIFQLLVIIDDFIKLKKQEDFLSKNYIFFWLVYNFLHQIIFIELDSKRASLIFYSNPCVCKEQNVA